ncbi:MAG: rRNA maturation RNase YbeY [Gaiellales bacterium]
MLEVEVDNRSLFRIDEAAARSVMRSALAAEAVTAGEVGVIFVEPGEMADLNGRHRSRAQPTDVLSFPVDGVDRLPAGLPRQLGDVVVCPQVAAELGTPIELLLVHGSLHLLGYDHEADEGRMLRRQAELVAEVERVAADPA